MNTKVVTLKAPGGTIKRLQKAGLPRQIQVKFIRVTLNTDEPEVLVTSLVENDWSHEQFKTCYGLRWGIETYFERLKERLNLENFSGKSVESVLQDLHSTCFICNLERIMMEDLDDELLQTTQQNAPRQKVNKAVSFNLLKHKMFDSLYDRSLEIEVMLEKMMQCCLQSTTMIRPNRLEPRDKSGPYRRLRHHKTKKKICF